MIALYNRCPNPPWASFLLSRVDYNGRTLRPAGRHLLPRGAAPVGVVRAVVGGNQPEREAGPQGTAQPLQLARYALLSLQTRRRAQPVPKIQIGGQEAAGIQAGKRSCSWSCAETEAGALLDRAGECDFLPAAAHQAQPIRIQEPLVGRCSQD